MFRTPSMAALALALMSSAAFAQNGAQAGAYDRADGPPAQMSNDNSSYGNRDYGPPASAQNQAPANAQAQAQDEQAHDMYCRRDAAARTGYVTPGEAAHDARTSSQVGGTLGGAALGAVIGSASHSAGAGALIGAGAGLIAGTVVGSDNGHRAASNVERAYSAAYYACMDGDEADDRGPPASSAYGYGPPPPAYYGPSYYGPDYYGYGPYPYYYGPAVSFGFGFGGYHGWHGGGFHGGGRGFHR